MRYNDNDTSEMSARLLYLVANFDAALKDPGNNLTYTGPKVEKAEHARQQDTVPHILVPLFVERLCADLVKQATANGTLEEIAPVLKQAAAKYKGTGQDIGEVRTLMQFAPA